MGSDGKAARVSQTPAEKAYAVGDARNSHPNNNEPNQVPTENNGSENLEAQLQDGGHHFGPPSDEAPVDESKICLLDTACTACMHSRKWRLEYQKTLPHGVCCTVTPAKKVFHFANGQSSGDSLQVWRIPIFLNGYKGEVYSAEVPEGNTPLLMSISSMTALDMVLHMRLAEVEVKALQVTLPLVTTKTKHVGIEVAYDPEVGQRTFGEIDHPSVISEREDLLVYFTQEGRLSLLSLEHPVHLEALKSKKTRSETALQVGDRGVKVDDRRFNVSRERGAQLDKAIRRVTAEDRRTWAALKREYTVAEQMATNNFQQTVIFEPFAGSYGTTRIAASEFGWTNSQPIDLLDGYDILTAAGSKLIWNTLTTHRPFLVIVAFDCRIWSLLTNCNPGTDWDGMRESVGRRTLQLVSSICQFQHDSGRFYLVENPAGSYAWVFQAILAKLMDSADGKFVIGDQCCFGKKDLETGKPIRKASGYLSNNEHVLNKIGKRCKCPWGSHQLVIGQNRYGMRSKQASAYPQDLCRAICQGVLESMIFEYSWRMVHHEGAFPVTAEVETEERVEDIPFEQLMAEEPLDRWVFDDSGALIRIHEVPRQHLFVPLSSDDTLPVELDFIETSRTTLMRMLDGSEAQTITDDWTRAQGQVTSGIWTGETRFTVKYPPIDGQHDDELFARPPQSEPGQPSSQQRSSVARPDQTLKRRRNRTRQLQRGFWQESQDADFLELLQRSLTVAETEGGRDWHRLDEESDLFQEWRSIESVQAEVTLILMSRSAKRLRKPQPFMGAAEVPLRKSFILLKDRFLTTDWEQWSQLSPATQIRPLIAKDRHLYIAVFGRELGTEVVDDHQDDRWKRLEEERERKFQALPRELKLAVKRIHVNLGHANTSSMLRALRISKASESALKAVRLFRCPDCPRMQNPKEPRPSKLPITDEFNVQIGVDIIQEMTVQDNNGLG